MWSEGKRRAEGGGGMEARTTERREGAMGEGLGMGRHEGQGFEGFGIQVGQFWAGD